MISIVIPTLNAEAGLGRTLAALVPAVVEGLVREVIVSDGGSSDHTLAIADHAGAEIVSGPAGRGAQLRAGAARARFPWLLFLHADTVLEPGWERSAAEHIDSIDSGRRSPAAGVFRFVLDDSGIAPRLVEKMVALRAGVLGLPYGDQGLLIARRLYDDVGGFTDMPIMEDVDIVRRLGRRRIRMLPVRATTSAARYRETGYVRRIARNQACLLAYVCRVPPERIARSYAQALASARRP